MKKTYPTQLQICKELPFLRVVKYCRDESPVDEAEKHRGAGIYYYFGMAGCLPDSDFYGPFKTPMAAIRNAYDLFGEC